MLINELVNGSANSDSDSFYELRNWGATAVDLTGWEVYRCSVAGLRSNVGRTEGDLSGVILQPGQVYTVSRIGMPGDGHISQAFETSGFGLYLEAPDDSLVDGIGVYPNEPWPMQSDCTMGRNLPNSLNYAANESWQRIANTGTIEADFIEAPATPGAQNATEEPGTANSSVIISEFAAAGPSSKEDEFVELRNLGTTAQDIGGWQLYRCTGTGRLRPDTREATVPSGTMLEPGKYFVFGGPAFGGPANLTYPTGLADVTSGALVQTADGHLVDRIAVSAYADSACQSGDDKLPAELDYVAGESYQQTAKGFIIASRTPGKANTTVASSVFGEQFAYQAKPGVAISEFGTDPAVAEMPVGKPQHNFVELGNYGDETVDLGDWTIRRCEISGIRSLDVQLTIPEGTKLKPGKTFVAARAGSPVAGDATYSTAFNMLGTGVWIADAHGNRVDSMSAYSVNEMDNSLVTPSPCTKGMTLSTFLPDRILGETFQRTRFTGVDADDFVTRAATPGVIDDIPWVDPTLRVAANVPTFEAPVETTEAAPADAVQTDVIESWSGVSDAPLTTETGANEIVGTAPIADNGWAYPYQRFVLDASALTAGTQVSWSGSTTGRNELQLSVWSPVTSSWRLLDAGSGTPLTPGIRLTGSLIVGDIANGKVTLLVQDGPRTLPTLAGARDGQLENPKDYDLAISHITDTQYLSENYPDVYAQLVSWIADNAAGRKIDFATHTGDIVQNWVDPNQDDARARHEYERASAIEGILDDAGIPNSVLPGNHDNKRGNDNSLFNEYFGPQRYEGSSWYGGSIAPGDNSANFSTFDDDGAKFLMLSLPYAYGDREITWAAGIVTSHPGYNVVISTHEHVTPKSQYEDAHVSANSHWVSHGQDLWDRVIAPNKNVVIVLSGHFHGLGQIRTENAGGIEGHDVVELLADYQEFRTGTGERATGFQRLLQFDLASSTVAVDTFSVRLNASYSYEYDYPQFVEDTGLANSASNERPWNIVAAGVQDRYTAEDDEFTASVGFQYPKLVATESLVTAPPLPGSVVSDGSATTASGSRDLSYLFRTTTT